MKTLKESGPAELAAVKRRALRTLAMGKISAGTCSHVVAELDKLIVFINQSEEREEER